MNIQPVERTRRRLEKRHAMRIGGGGIWIPGVPETLGGGAPPPLNFASLFTGVLQSVQTDLGLIYGGTMLAAGTTPVACALTGSPAVPVPVLVTCTAAGTIGVSAGATRLSISFDGGSTQAMTNVSPLSISPVALTGAGTGISLQFAAGAAALDNTWTATSAGLSDQSGNGFPYLQATAASQPILRVGLNGSPGLLFDGVDDAFTSTLALPAPGTTPTWAGLVFRVVTWSASKPILASNDATQSHRLFMPNLVSPNGRVFNGSVGNVVDIPVGSWEATEIGFQNTAADYLRRGNVAASSGVTFGNNVSAARSFGGIAPGVALWSNVELLHIIHTNNIPTAPQIAAWRAAITTKYGGAVLV